MQAKLTRKATTAMQVAKHAAEADLTSCFAFALSTRNQLQLMLVPLQRRVGRTDRHSKQQYIILLRRSSQAV